MMDVTLGSSLSLIVVVLPVLLVVEEPMKVGRESG